MNKFMNANKKIENSVVSGYKNIEKGVVDSYKAVEGAFVNGYKKIENKFVRTFLTPDVDINEEKGDEYTREHDSERSENNE